VTGAELLLAGSAVFFAYLLWGVSGFGSVLVAVPVLASGASLHDGSLALIRIGPFAPASLFPGGRQGRHCMESL